MRDHMIGQIWYNDNWTLLIIGVTDYNMTVLVIDRFDDSDKFRTGTTHCWFPPTAFDSSTITYKRLW